MSQYLKNAEDFILKYKAAIKTDLTVEQFASYLNIKPKSVKRRRLSIFHKTGLNLKHLKSDKKSKLTDEIEEEFEENLKDIAHKANPTKLVKSSGPNKKRYVITSAQNATPIHENFLKAIQVFCEANNAELLIIPYRYKNPTSLWTDNNKDEEYWDSKIVKYLMNKRMELSSTLHVMGQIKMQPTAVSPLSGLDSYTGSVSGIFGHPKIEWKTVPTPNQKLPKILSTTGTITIPNYTDSKAGHKGGFHHSLAAMVVEISDDTFFPRHIHANEDGSFYDLNNYYTSTGYTTGHRIAGLVTGDIHAEFIDPKVEEATYKGKDSMMEVLNPEVWVIHDLEDFYSRSHHHRNNDLLNFGKHHFGRNNVEESLQVSANFVDKYSRDNMLNLIVKSNHDEALDRWLREADPKVDPENALFYHYMKYNQYLNLKRTDTGFETIDPFEFWCKNPITQGGLRNIDKTKFLKRDESFVVSNIEVGFHGDKGPNGSFGNIRSFSKIGPKVVIGHSHTPGIFEGVYQVGVSARLNLEYQIGPSSWMHTHCLIYPDGHRTLINIVKSKWKL